MKIVIHTDGSCLGNPGAGGYGAIIQKGEKEVVLRGGEPDTTNNRMEMKAVVKALEWLAENEKDTEVDLHTDSTLVVKSMTEGWKRKTNHDIWADLDAAIIKLDQLNIKINWNWVKGHAGNEINERVDEIAVEESKKQPQGASKKISESGLFICPKCKKEVGGLLGYMPDSDMIRVDCENCGSFIKFGEQTEENLRMAKERPLIRKDQLAEVVKIKEAKGEEVTEKVLKKLKTWTEKEADEFIGSDQKLF